ncbi:signal peptidase I [Shouchella shacheensis]|uniref:signal peptidase I n=1 Tax=Shouchella shacheensis TaxID=1649580 RepID=UPI000AC127E6|nr:signal peptidase I [Shouchella shacheensis]
MARAEDKKEKSEFWGWVKAIVIALVLALIIRTFIMTSFEVRGDSMVPTAQNGERFIVNKMPYHFSEPERFDLIVFQANENEDYIKRVVGLPGESVRYEEDRLYVNDELVEEPFLEDVRQAYDGRAYTPDYEFEMEVPADHVFVMGDNRPISLDSRSIGPIDEEDIIGKVGLRFWPLGEFGTME